MCKPAHRLRQQPPLDTTTSADRYMTSFYNGDSCLDNCGSSGHRHPRMTDASSHGETVINLPNEIWLLVLSWGGLRTSATAAACSSAFRSLHRTVAATPALLARALLEDYALTEAVSKLYDSPAGHPHEWHAVHSDAGVAATLRNLVVLSAPPSVAVSAAAAAASAASAAASAAAAVVTAEAEAADGTAAASTTTPLAPILTNATTLGIVQIGWCSGGAAAFRQLLDRLLCASASAGHIHVAATALALGATEREGALLAAAAAGRRRAVRLLLAAGADPDAAGEAFGPCALYQAARNGNTDIAELLLDAGARVDGAAATTAAAAMPYSGRRSAVPLPPVDPWRLWPALGSGGASSGGPSSGAAPEGATPRYPLPLRVPVPLAAAAAAPPPPPMLAARALGPQEAFFSDSVLAGGATAGGVSAASSPTRRLNEPPKTPSAATAATAAAAFKSTWGDDNDDDEGGGGGGGAPTPRTPAAQPAPLMPPPLPLHRKQPLPLPLSRAPLPLMPSLSSAPPLPPAMMMMLHGGFQSRPGPSPLLGACRSGHAATAAMLLRRGAKTDSEGGAELLGAANPDVVDELLAAVPGLAVHLGAALLAAASANRLEVVSELLRRGADPAYRGGMALTEAAFKGHLAVMAALLEAGGGRLRESGALTAALELSRTWGRTEALQLLTTTTTIRTPPNTNTNTTSSSSNTSSKV